MARIELPSGTPAEFALPPEGDPLRGVVVAADVSGLRPLFDDMAASLAAEHGWVVCVVEPYPGQADVPVDARLAGRLDLEGQLRDLQAAADVVQERTGVARVAVIGFCMGGMNAMRAAGTGRFDRAVAFYGMIRPPENWSHPGDDPLDALARAECCPVLAIIGGQDEWTPAADVDALRSVGAHVTVRSYADASHGFVHDPSRPAHRAGDAADAWRWAVEFVA
ncbi:MAG TPA: dienelactone hydrolase family protein [Acidimicrobiales bacterium]